MSKDQIVLFFFLITAVITIASGKFWLSVSQLGEVKRI